MRRIIRTICLVFIAALAGIWFVYTQLPHTRSKAPIARYHGYDLNHAAIERAKYFTVLISNEGFSGLSRGSGVLLDSKHVLTCAHVAEGGNDEMWVYFWPGRVNLKAKVAYISNSKDLAILELIGGHVVGLSTPTIQGTVYDGEPITIMGNALGAMKWFVAYGILSGSNNRDLYTDGLVLGGDSGGPWINERGEVVAISDWGMEIDGKSIGISGGISGTTILEFLNDWRHPSIFSILLGG